MYLFDLTDVATSFVIPTPVATLGLNKTFPDAT